MLDGKEGKCRSVAEALTASSSKAPARGAAELTQLFHTRSVEEEGNHHLTDLDNHVTAFFQALGLHIEAIHSRLVLEVIVGLWLDQGQMDGEPPITSHEPSQNQLELAESHNSRTI